MVSCSWMLVVLVLWLALSHTGGSDNASEIDREICTAPSAKAGVNKAQGYEAKLKDIDRYIDPNLLLMW